MPKYLRNVRQGEGFQIQSGDIRGIGRSKTEGAAFRQLIKMAGKGAEFGILARYRIVRLKDLAPLSPWFYMDVDALRKVR